MIENTCAICGKENATTREHIPPRAIFNKPNPSNLVTVPACIRCNGGTSKLDEKFKIFVSLKVGDNREDTKLLWKSGAMRTLKHAKPLHKELLKSSQEITQSNGEKTGIVGIPKEDINTVIRKCIKGLYYHHFNSILENNVSIEIKIQENNPTKLLKSIEFERHSMGNDAFVYYYRRTYDKPNVSVWILQFYKLFWCIAYTGMSIPNNRGAV